MTERIHSNEETARQAADAPETPLGELWGVPLRIALEQRFPGLERYIDASLDSFYGALAFAVEWEEATGGEAAAPMWLRRSWPARRRLMQTYDHCLDDFAQLVMFATHDAALSEHMARNGIYLDNLYTCERCGDLVGLDCRCGREVQP